MAILNISLIIFMLYFTSFAHAIDIAPRISDREIVERLTRLEEGQKTLRTEIKANSEAIKQLRDDINLQFDRIDSQFGGIDSQFDRIDSQFGGIDSQFGRIDSQFGRIDSQFNRLTNIMLGILGAFVTLVGGIIWFALWDRRSMVRPFETKIKDVEEEIANNRSKLHSLIETFRTLSKSDEKVAAVLKKFNLL